MELCSLFEIFEVDSNMLRTIQELLKIKKRKRGKTHGKEKQ